MDPTLAAMRQEYEAQGLTESDLLPNPIAQFERWFEAARAAGIEEPNAMILATAGPDGQPAARIVLLKMIDQRGLAFFTNRTSRKGRELAANPRAALTFWWGPLHRQVRFEGLVSAVDAAESDAYFASRPLGAQIGAWASPQSAPIASRAELEAAEARCRERFAGQEVPRPDHWGGYRLAPALVEFWQGRANRLHDRLRYRKDGGGWRIERLGP
jgi:pyridoxamine 5'-phosphate oxidase